MNAIRPIRMTADRAVTFRAWIVGTAREEHPRHESYPAEVPLHCATAQQVANHIACDLFKNRQIMVLQTNAAERPERRNLVTLFEIKRKTTGWEYPKDGGRKKAVYTCFGVAGAQFCVPDDFKPIRPWRASDGNAVGLDRSLVEQRS